MDAFTRAIAFEAGLEGLIRARKKRYGVRHLKAAEGASLIRIHGLYNRAVRRFRADEELWLQWVDFAASHGSGKRLDRIFPRALRLLPSSEGLWARAAAYQHDERRDPAAARTLLQRGLRVNPGSSSLWLGLFRLELAFALRLRARRVLLGVPGAGLAAEADEARAAMEALSGGEAAALAAAGGDDATARLLEGSVAGIVLDSAAKALPGDAALRLGAIRVLDEAGRRAAGSSSAHRGPVSRLPAEASDLAAAARLATAPSSFPRLEAAALHGVVAGVPSVPGVWGALARRALLPAASAARAAADEADAAPGRGRLTASAAAHWIAARHADAGTAKGSKRQRASDEDGEADEDEDSTAGVAALPLSGAIRAADAAPGLAAKRSRGGSGDPLPGLSGDDAAPSLPACASLALSAAMDAAVGVLRAGAAACVAEAADPAAAAAAMALEACGTLREAAALPPAASDRVPAAVVTVLGAVSDAAAARLDGWALPPAASAALARALVSLARPRAALRVAAAAMDSATGPYSSASLGASLLEVVLAAADAAALAASADDADADDAFTAAPAPGHGAPAKAMLAMAGAGHAPGPDAAARELVLSPLARARVLRVVCEEGSTAQSWPLWRSRLEAEADAADAARTAAALGCPDLAGGEGDPAVLVAVATCCGAAPGLANSAKLWAARWLRTRPDTAAAAVAALRLVVAGPPPSVGACAAVAAVCEAAGDVDAAAAAWDRACLAHPSDADAWTGLVLLLRREGRVLEASDAASRACSALGTSSGRFLAAVEA